MNGITEHFHIHVNIQKELPPEVGDYLSQRGFKIVRYQILEETWEPLWICTAKQGCESKVLLLYDEVLQKLRSPQLGVRGYVEAERVLHNNVCRFIPGDKGVDLSEFPLKARPMFISDTRGADLHIFRESRNEFDQLDRHLLSLGFYPVTSKEQTIWTLLLQDFEDAQKLFDSLRGYFEGSYQVSKLEVEQIICGKLGALNSPFQFRPVAAKGLAGT